MPSKILEVLICTIDHRIEHALRVLLEPQPHIRYLIAWQQSSEAVLPEIAIPEREDLSIIKSQGKGLAKNRNVALRNASGDILLIADDDNRYTLDYLNQVLKAFDCFSAADIITFQAVDMGNRPLKRYPPTSFLYHNRPKGFYVSSVEIALKKEADLPFFDERFGLGTEFLTCGEEEKFIEDAAKAGLEIIYYPCVIVKTPAETSGSKFHEEVGIRRSKGSILYCIHGSMGAYLRSFKYILSLRRLPLKQRYSFLKDMFTGIHYVKATS